MNRPLTNAAAICYVVSVVIIVCVIIACLISSYRAMESLIDARRAQADRILDENPSLVRILKNQ